MTSHNTYLPAARVFSGVTAFHSFVIKWNGDVYASGNNNCGQLGIGDMESRVLPKKVPYFAENGVKVQHIACGNDHTLFLLMGGKVCGCGSNNMMQLGHPRDQDNFSTPVCVDLLDNVSIVEVCCGYWSSYCLSSDGTVYSFGWNEDGQLGLGTAAYSASVSVVEFSEGVKIVRISCGSRQVAAVAEDGAVYTWGSVYHGQIGREDHQRVPMKVKGLPEPRDSDKVQVICGFNFTTVISNPSDIYTFGDNEFGQLGISNNEFQIFPVRIGRFNTEKLHRISVGSFHTICQMESGRILGYGRNRWWQLLQSDQIDRNRPTEVRISCLEVNSIVDIVCGVASTLLVTEDAKCYGVGFRGIFGQKETFSTPELLLEGVDLGHFERIEMKILKCAINDQKVGEREKRTTDLCLWVRSEHGRHPIWLNRAVLEARYAIILESDDICVQHYDEVALVDILKLVYTDKDISSVGGREIEEKLGDKRMSMNDCLRHLYAQKDAKGDVVITSEGGVSFKAHKFILVATTSYFRALYRGEWTETSSSEVQLETQLDDFFEDYLRYLYTGDVNCTSSAALERFNEYIDYFGE